MPNFPLISKIEWPSPNFSRHSLPVDTNSIEQRFPSAWPTRQAIPLLMGNLRFCQARESIPEYSRTPGLPSPRNLPGT